MRNATLVHVMITCLLVEFLVRRMFRCWKPTFHRRRHHTELSLKQILAGFFTAFNVCTDAQQELFITKANFVSMKKNATMLTPTTANVVARLEIAGKL